MEFFNEHIASNKYIFAGFIIVTAVIAAVIVDFIVSKILLNLAKKTKTQVDDDIIKVIHKPLFLSVVLAGVAVAFRKLTSNDTYIFIIDGVIITVAVLLCTTVVSKIGQILLDAMSRRKSSNNVVQKRTLPFFEIVLKSCVFAGAAYGILLAWKVDVTAWLASAGILGIAIGFAAKDTLANMFAGIFILADAPYKIGDFIVVDSNDRGMVTDIGMRTTRIVTRDDIEIIIPNAVIANSKIINESGGPHLKERVRVNVGVAYGSDVKKVKDALLKIADDCTLLETSPEPRVRFRELGESSINFQLMGWIKEPVLRGRTIDNLYTAIHETFKKENIAIPFPQRDIHMKSE